MPLGCIGGFQTTVAIVSDMLTTSIISTIPGAVEFDNKLITIRGDTIQSYLLHVFYLTLHYLVH